MRYRLWRGTFWNELLAAAGNPWGSGEIVGGEFRLAKAVGLVVAALPVDVNPFVDRNAGDGLGHGVRPLLFAHAQRPRVQVLRKPFAVHIDEGLHLSRDAQDPAERPARHGTVGLLNHIAAPDQAHFDDPRELLSWFKAAGLFKLRVRGQRVVPLLARDLALKCIEERGPYGVSNIPIGVKDDGGTGVGLGGSLPRGRPGGQVNQEREQKATERSEIEPLQLHVDSLSAHTGNCPINFYPPHKFL